MEKQTVVPALAEKMLSSQELLELAKTLPRTQPQSVKVNKTLDVWIKAKKERV